MAESSIEWTERTWNPIVGCSLKSPGCVHCYAMTMARRIEACNAAVREGHGSAPHYNGTTKLVNGKAVWTGKVAMADDHALTAPLRRKKPTTYFVNSMGDLFHENVPDEWIDKVFAVMALAPQHTFQVLTKRAERMRRWLAAGRADSVGLAMLTIVDRIPHGHRQLPWPLANVWLGVSTEDQRRADERIPHLLATPAAVRFISAEPLLGPIDLMEVIPNPIIWGPVHGVSRNLDWVIVGGESGPDARPMHPDWARSLRDQCAEAGVPFFFKQWGQWRSEVFPGVEVDLRTLGKGEKVCANPNEPGTHVRYFKVGKAHSGRLLDGREYNGMPEARPC